MRLDRRDAVVGMASQVASSLTNLALSIAVARHSSLEEFGLFGLVFGGFLLLTSISRSFLIEPAVVSANRAASTIRVEGHILGGALLIHLPLVCGLLVLLAATVDMTGAAIAAAGLSVGAAGSQDLVRSYAIGLRRSDIALASDVAFLGVQLVLLVASLAGELSFVAALAGWGVAALSGLLVGLWRLGTRPLIIRGARRAWEQRSIGLIWAADTAAVSAVGKAMPWILFALAGLYEAAAFRGSLVLLGPTTVVFVGLRLISLPRLASTHVSRVWKRSIMLLWAFVGLSLVLGLPLLGIPDDLGRAMLGETWEPGRDLLVVALVWRTLSVASLPLSLAVRSVSASRIALAVRVKVSVASLVCGVMGAATMGGKGAYLGLATASAMAIPLWLRGLSEAIAGTPGAAPVTAPAEAS
jgi:O-antigen/teichoic acid export membrane protein